MEKMEIKKVDIGDIIPYYDNPRDNVRAVAPVIESFRKFGFIKPIICDSDGIIIAGHTRYIAAYQLGLKYIPVIYSDMDSEKARMFRIVDNKIAEKSEFNEDELIEELKKMQIPTSMQAFFFEDIGTMLNFSLESMEKKVEDAGGFDIYGSPNDNLDEIDGKEEASNYETENRYDENGLTEEDKEIEKLDPAYGLFQVMTRMDGTQWMKVVCPYCGNVEQIEIND